MLKLTYPQVWFTYGPQTKDDHIIRQLINAGATGARLTFSFGTPELQVERAMQLKRIATDLDRPFVVVADLQGEKCRFAKIDGVEEIEVDSDKPFLLTKERSDLATEPMSIAVQIPAYLESLQPGDIILEGDGALMIVVKERTQDGILCSATKNGKLHPGRGIIVQKRDFRPRSTTEKDIADLRAIARAGIFDAVAVSFVASPDEVDTVRSILAEESSDLSIIAKIETQSGVEFIDGIAAVSDGIMIARGDLALTSPWLDLYANTLKVASSSKNRGRPWILATQIVEGMERFEFPTRAEICDLAHWVSFGADVVMLSYETAFGPRPIDSIRAVRSVFDRYAVKS